MSFTNTIRAGAALLISVVGLATSAPSHACSQIMWLLDFPLGGLPLLEGLEGERLNPGVNLIPAGNENSGTGVIRIPGFVIKADENEQCAVAVSLSNAVRIDQVRFLASDGSDVGFAPFLEDPVVAATFGPSYRAYVGEAPQGLAATVAVLELQYTVRVPDVNIAQVGDVVARSRIVTGQIAPDGQMIGKHAEFQAADDLSICLNELDPDTGLLTCPRPVDLGELIAPARTTIDATALTAREFTDACPVEQLNCSCILDGFFVPCEFLAWCLEVGGCVQD